MGRVELRASETASISYPRPNTCKVILSGINDEHKLFTCKHMAQRSSGFEQAIPRQESLRQLWTNARLAPQKISGCRASIAAADVGQSLANREPERC